MSYYVYVFFDAKAQNEVFYVGKGRGRRAGAHLALDGLPHSSADDKAADATDQEVGARTEELLATELHSPNGVVGDDIDQHAHQTKGARIQKLLDAGVGASGMIRVVAQGLDEPLARTIESFAIRFVFGLKNLTNQVQGWRSERFRARDDWDTDFGESVNESTPYYVYVLMDPSTKEVFYVGKGTGSRKTAHFREAESLNEEQHRLKHQALVELSRRGYSADEIARVIACDLDQREAFAIECFALKYVYGMTAVANANVVRGHHSHHFRAKDDWALRLGFDLPFIAAADGKKAREMERDLMLGEAMDLPLRAVLESFPELDWSEPRIADSGELVYEALVSVLGEAGGGRIKVFIRSKGGVQVEFRGRTKLGSDRARAHLCSLNYAPRRDGTPLVYFPDAWVGKPTSDPEEGKERVRMLLALLNGRSREQLIRSVGEAGVAVLLSEDPVLRATVEQKRVRRGETRRRNAAKRSNEGKGETQHA